MGVADYINYFQNPETLDQFIGFFVWGFLGIGAILLSIWMIRNVVKYRYRGEIERLRQGDDDEVPTSKIIEGKAGYFKRRGKQVFRIKYGMMPWQLVEVRRLPDPRYMRDNKAYFIQYNIGELVQAKKYIDKDVFRIMPVENTTKNSAKQELYEHSKIFDKSNLLKENLGIAIMGLVFVAGLVAMYFVSKACGG